MKKNGLYLLFLSFLLIPGCSPKEVKKEEKPEETAHHENPVIESIDENEEEEDDDDEYSYLFLLDSDTKTKCLVDPMVKEYTDKMYEQRENDNWADEDKINSLHGDKIKIKNYMGNYDSSIPAEVYFKIDDSLKEDSFRVRCWEKGDKKHYKEEVAVGGAARFNNLKRGTEYEWKVISSSGKKSGVESFKTEEYVRILTCGKLYNVRDCGGWHTVDGKRIKQGYIYRGGEINGVQYDFEHKKNVTEEGMNTFIKEFGIKRQIDLRNETESHGITSCPMNREDAVETDPDYVSYTRLEIDSYSNGLNVEEYQKNIKTCFEQYFTNVDKEPIYLNCYGGADRTGTISFLLGALLGMSYTDLIIDYESTSFCNNYKAHDVSQSHSKFPEMIASIKRWPFYDETKSLKSIIETFLTQVCGVSNDAIAKIREILLEDIIVEEPEEII